MLGVAVPVNDKAPLKASFPSEPMANADIEAVLAVVLATYKSLAVGETTMVCGVAGTVNGDPEISVSSRRAGSMLNTEMLVEPWLRTNRNWPPALTPRATGFVPTGLGAMAVPTGTSTPEVWFKEYPDTWL